MSLGIAILGGSAQAALARDVARDEGHAMPSCRSRRFPDGELHVEVDPAARGYDLYLVQSLGSPVGESLIELALLEDAARRVGAASVSAVIPYLGYARQDRRVHEGEAVGLRAIANLLGRLRLRCIVLVDPHIASVESCFDVPVERLSAVPLLVERLRRHARKSSVIVAPDLGAAKLAQEYAHLLGLPMAVVHKVRKGGYEVESSEIYGDVKDKRPMIVDDMISTGGTIEACVRLLEARGAERDITVAATHALFAGDARERLRRLPIARFVVTDSLPIEPDGRLPIEVVEISSLIANAIYCIHERLELGTLLARA